MDVRFVFKYIIGNWVLVEIKYIFFCIRFSYNSFESLFVLEVFVSVFREKIDSVLSWVFGLEER